MTENEHNGDAEEAGKMSLEERVEQLERAVAGLHRLVTNEVGGLKDRVKKALQMAHSVAGLVMPPEVD